MSHGGKKPDMSLATEEADKQNPVDSPNPNVRFMAEGHQLRGTVCDKSLKDPKKKDAQQPPLVGSVTKKDDQLEDDD